MPSFDEFDEIDWNDHCKVSKSSSMNNLPDLLPNQQVFLETEEVTRKMVDEWMRQEFVMDAGEKLALWSVFERVKEIDQKEDLIDYYNESFLFLAAMDDFDNTFSINNSVAVVSWRIFFQNKFGFSEEMSHKWCTFFSSQGTLSANQCLWDAVVVLCSCNNRSEYYDVNVPTVVTKFLNSLVTACELKENDIFTESPLSGKKDRNRLKLYDTPIHKQRRNSSDARINNSLLADYFYESDSKFEPISSSTSKFKGLCGLENQGATCYMNSLLQSLYMTPEFRRGIFSWIYDLERDGPKEDCIAYQLQQLFGKMQLSGLKSVETTNLTKSFGWDDYEGFKQQDAQEMCRVLFDAIEKNFHSTHLSNLINDLYQGSITDYVECKGCNKSNERKDNFLDVSLVVRDTSSLHEAMEIFLKPELLDGDNAYRCGSCGNKCSASKGIKFNSLPYILTFQLKRFDFDFETLTRVKLNNKFSFPFFADFNKYVFSNLSQRKIENDNESFHKDGKVKNNLISEELKEQVDLLLSMSGCSDEYNKTDAQIISDVLSKPEFSEKRLISTFMNASDVPSFSVENPYIYELFGVLVHSGNALGGHYYAYIKSLSDNNWYKFNDNVVSQSSQSEVASDSFGGESCNSYSTISNAYMLLYRQMDISKNQSFCNDADIIATGFKVEEETSKYVNRYDPSACDLNLVYIHEDKTLEKSITISKNSTLLELTEKASRLFNILPEIDGLPLECYVRVRAWNSYNKLPADTFIGRMNDTISNLGFYNSKWLLVETKSVSDIWTEFSNSDIWLKIHLVDTISEEYLPFQYFQVDKESNFLEFQELVSRKFGIPEENLFICKINNFSIAELKVLEIDSTFPSQNLSGYSIYSCDDIYIENSPDVSNSIIRKLFERDKNVLEISFNDFSDITNYPNIIKIDSSLTLGDLKLKLAEHFGIDCSEFKIFHGSEYLLSYESPELRDLNEVLKKIPVRDGAKIMVKRGTPILFGQFKTKIELYDSSTADDSKKFQFFCEIGIFRENSVKDIQEILSREYLQKFSAYISPARFRIRDVSNVRATSVFDPTKTYCENAQYVYDGKKLCVQIVQEDEEVFNSLKLLIRIQCFDPQTFKIDPHVYELYVLKNLTLKDFAFEVAKKLPSIEPNFVAVIKPWQYQVANPTEFQNDQWHVASEILYHSSFITKSPFFWNEGDLIIVRDSSIPMRELTESEKEILNIEFDRKEPDSYYSIPDTSSKYTLKSKHQETGISIKTKCDRDKEK